jgi:multiple sugar transport system ATP-binding protein
MCDGRLQQVGRPADVYANPANLFVAGFLGTPSMNMISGRIERGVMNAGALRLVAPGAPDGEVVVGIRPEGLNPAAAGDTGPSFEVVVSHVEALGNENLVHGWVTGDEPSAKPMVLRAPPSISPRADERLRVVVDPAQVLLFDKVTEQRVSVTGPVAGADDHQIAG